MERRMQLMDAGVAGLVFGTSLAILAAGGFGSPDPRAHQLDALGVVLAAASALPLAARRQLPGTVFGVTGVATIVLLYLRFPLDVPLGSAIAAYTLAVAYGGDQRPARRRAAMIAVAAFVPIIGATYAASGVDVWTIAPELLGWSAVFAAVWIAGDRTRLRRAQIRDLAERAHRREQDSERERRLAVATERTRIARELHDSAGHAINVILVQAGAARLLQERNPEASREAMVTIEHVARETIGEIDRIVRALRDDDGIEPPAPIDAAAIEELVDRHRASGLGIVADLRSRDHAPPRSVALAAYRILQEALTNAARHGRGQAEVTFVSRADAVEIAVSNPTGQNGSVPGGGHGIVGMRERATLLGGSLDVDADGGVFRLHVVLPYQSTSP